MIRNNVITTSQTQTTITTMLDTTIIKTVSMAAVTPRRTTLVVLLQSMIAHCKYFMVTNTDKSVLRGHLWYKENVAL